MKQVSINFNEKTGRVKPMHAVNNGPVYKFAIDQRITNLPAWMEAGIPYARTHDSAFYNNYGGPHIIDVNLIFRNFDADPYAPESYDFACTDEYIRVVDLAKTKVFYRLGASIEHWIKKYNTLPPKDFKKWAVICEHIIRHYTEGWADGFNYDIEYWEIWNEPDLDADDCPNKRTWGGTKAQFFDLYETAAKHLKEMFPNLKIGGPALAWNLEWAKDFLTEMKKRNAPMDFFSWHVYAYNPEYVIEKSEIVRKMLDESGYIQTESINDEWNYVRSFEGDGWIYSLKTEKKMKGAAFILSTICAGQYSSMDMLMYYDARQCGMNGMFDTEIVSETLKGYYPFKMFNELYKLGESSKITCDKNLFGCAAQSGDKAAFIVSHFNDDDDTPAERVKVNIEGFSCKDGVKASYYLLNEAKDLELVKEEIFFGESYSTVLESELYSGYLVMLEKC